MRTGDLRRWLLFGALALLVAAPCRSQAQAWDTLKLTWNAPDAANGFGSAPIGNGHIGARIGGGVGSEVLQLNDKTFWSGGPGLTPPDPKRRLALVETRKRLAADDIPGANAAAEGMWGSNDMGTFLPLGRLMLAFDHGADATGYRRVLDIDRAVSTVQYTIGGVTYTREAFASFPDDVIVMRLTSSAPGKISFTARLSYPPEMQGHGASVATDDRNALVMQGKAPANTGWDPQQGMRFEARLKIAAPGGTVSAKEGALSVANADSAVLIFANATSYSGFSREPGTQGVDPTPIVKETLARAAAKSYDELLQAHVADYQPLFRRVWVDINGETPNVYALGFQYSRYDMIACSRLGDRPHNQQGMWNSSWTPTSHSAHWLNENVEKYYSLIETANLPECGEPLWNWMDELATSGAQTARIDWGFHGWTVGQCSDIWAKTTLASGNNEWSIWPMGGVWLCQNLWDHYAFSQDAGFLRRRAYPQMKGAAEFCLDYLVDDGKGHLVTSPSTSPENRFALPNGQAYAVTVGTTSDMALVRQLFDNCIQASEILHVDPDFRAKLRATEAKLLPFRINSKGELQEWNEDYAIPQSPAKYNPHRHASHLLAVWPLNQITRRGTPRLFKAAQVSLQDRGRGGFHPDKGAMWARLGEGDRAIAAGSGSFQTGEGLIGKIPPKYAGFPELFVQSQADAIELLPALPTSWKSGSVSGLRARGDFVVAMTWSDGKLHRATLTSRSGKPARVRAATPLAVTRAGRPIPCTRPEPDVVQFSTDANAVYELTSLRDKTGL